MWIARWTCHDVSAAAKQFYVDVGAKRRSLKLSSQPSEHVVPVRVCRQDRSRSTGSSFLIWDLPLPENFV